MYIYVYVYATCTTTQWPVCEVTQHSSSTSVAPDLINTAPLMVGWVTSACACCLMCRLATRQTSRHDASMAGPFSPTRTTEPTGPLPAISTGLSRTKRS